MALIAMDKGRGNFNPVPAGNYIGRCYRVIDLGTQTLAYQGTRRAIHKVLLGWEMFGEDDTGQALVTDESQPLTIAKRYTLSLNEKAALRQDLEAWRGRAFTAAELGGFDLKNLLGVYGLVNVTHEAREGKTYSNVAGLSPVPKVLRAQQPPGVNALQFFEVKAPDSQVFAQLHEKLQLTIQSCAEWRAAAPPPSPKRITPCPTINSATG